MINAMEQLKKVDFGILVYDHIYGEDYTRLRDKGFYVYSIRHADSSQDEMATIEPNVRVNHYADIITTRELVFDSHNCIILDNDDEEYINEFFYHTSFTQPFKSEKEMEKNLINDMKCTGKDNLLNEIVNGKYEDKPNLIINYFLNKDQSIAVSPNGDYFYTQR